MWITLAILPSCKDVGVPPDTIVSPCINNKPVEDTNRVYTHLKLATDGSVVKVDTLKIVPNLLFVRLYPWVDDTAKILQLIAKHDLKPSGAISSLDQQLIAFLCVGPTQRAEYKFTPYGRNDFCNFGADTLVEYAFGVFSYGYVFPDGSITFKFVDGTPLERIDSLFVANGLRLLHTAPDVPTGTRYVTLVTPQSRRNVLDLGNTLRSVPFVVLAKVNLGISTIAPPCD